ncbi:MAG: hypothetical protein IJE51_05890 [Clostridia bacterium]|nr:hypothetical protein [Clostridia bacterium]
MTDKDLFNHFDSVQFETEVYPGVYWVPLNTLGKTRYTNEQVKEFVSLSAQEKKEKINNLYEAVQLFQASEFRGVYDNVDHKINSNILWQTHKNQIEAVKSNEGCCATDTNWLAYFIQDKYDKISSFCYANEDGNGHITTCIQQNSEFYFLDMMMCRNDSQPYLSKETGILSDLLEKEWAGFLYKCKDPLDFCKFHISRCAEKNRSIPFGFYMRETNCVFATGAEITKNGITFLIPKNENPWVIYCNKDTSCKLLFTDVPKPIEK